MATLTQGLSLIDQVRARNPQVADLSDRDLADIVYRRTQDQRLAPVAQSGALSRGVARTGMFVDRLGERAERAITRGTPSKGRRVAGRAASMLISSSPEMLLGALSGGTRGLARGLSAAGLGSFSYGRTMAETGDKTAAAGSAAGSLLGLYGGVKGSQLGRYLAGRAGSGRVGQFVGGSVGSSLGGVPGDALEIGTSPGGFEEFLSDPLNLPAYALVQAATGPVLDVAEFTASERRKRVQQKKQETLSLEDIVALPEQDELAQLHKVPVAERSERQIARMQELQTRLNRTAEQVYQKKLERAQNATYDDFVTLPETPETIRSQLYLVSSGKKPLVEVPRGTQVPQVAFNKNYTEYQAKNGNRYFYNPQLTSPEAIETAIGNNSLGLLLGYGVPSKPANPTGVLTLRTKRGLEKAAVVVDDATRPAAEAALQKLALGDDVMRLEAPADVLRWRVENQGLRRLFSLASQVPDQAGNLQFVNNIVRNFERALQPKIKNYRTVGPALTPDRAGNVNSVGLRRMLEKWAPADLFAHYKQHGLDALFEEGAPDPVYIYSVFGKEWPKRGYQVDPLINGGRGEPLKDVDRAKLPKPDFDNMASGQYVRQDGQWINVTGQDYDAIRTRFQKNVPGRVNLERFGQWLRENTPEVVEKQLVPKQLDKADKRAQIEHALETAGYQARYSGQPNDQGIFEVQGISRLGEQAVLSDDALPQSVLDLQDELVALGYKGDNESDAATGRYGVEPWRIEEMDRPSDILLRVPFDEKLWNQTIEDGGSDRRANRESGVQFEAGHFGNADKNVVASIRGTFVENGQSFFPWEIQSDWGQDITKVVKELESFSVSSLDRHFIVDKKGRRLESRRFPQLSRNFDNKAEAENALAAALKAAKEYQEYRFSQAPLVRHYETLAVKEIIMHALRNGARYIIIPDPKTVSDIQGHYTEEQIAGTQQHYGRNLRDIAKRLTRDSSPTHVNLGKTTVGYENDVTGWRYSLANISPEVTKLYSLYDMDRQTDFEREVKKAEQDAAGKERFMTPEAMLRRAVNGDASIETDALVKFWQAIKAIPNATKIAPFGDRMLGQTRLEEREVLLSESALRSAKQAFRTYAHELTHVAFQDLQASNPAAYEAIINNVRDLGYETRLRYLEHFAREYGMDSNYDPTYLAGKPFDPRDPQYDQMVAHEFVSGIVEALSEAHFQGQTRPEWMAWLPQGVQKLLVTLMNKLRGYINTGFPSITKSMNPLLDKRLTDVLESMSKHVIGIDTQQMQAALKLSNGKAFDEFSFRDTLPERERYVREALSNLKGLSREVYSFAKSQADEGGMLRKVANKFEEYFYSGLFRTRTKPETRDFFWALHNLRHSIQAKEYAFLGSLGQDASGSLTREQALERFAERFDSLVNPNNKRRNHILDSFSRVFEENQNRRERLARENPTHVVRESDLVSREEMIEKYKLNDEEADFLRKLVQMPQMVINQSLVTNKQVDTLKIAKFFFRLNREQNLEAVKQKATRLNQATEDIGALRFEREQLRKAVEKLQRAEEPDLDTIGPMQARMYELEGQLDVMQKMLGDSVFLEFGQDLKLEGPDDPRVAAAVEAIARLAQVRVHEMFITRDAGYAPMTRRGRFNLRVYEPSEFGAGLGKVKEYKGFETEKEAQEYIAKEGIKEGDFELIDKETLKTRARLYSPNRLKMVRDEAQQQFKDLLANTASKLDGVPDEFRERFAELLSDMEAEFRPLEEEIRDVVSVKGDKFVERRNFVKGFDRNDFLPNIFEYMNFKTVGSEKRLARAEAELQLERPQVRQDPELLERMTQELNYVMSNQNEFNTLRKGVFYFYLGASPRHVIQNAVQIPLNGVSQLAAEGAGFSAYKHFAKASKLLVQHNLTGTTGDPIIDALLKQADQDGTVLPIVLEEPVEPSINLQRALDTVHSNMSGTRMFGDQAGYQGAKLMKGIERFLQTTSTASDATNRRWAFLASILAERAKGVDDPTAIYGKAKEFTNFVNFVGDKANRPGYLIKHGNTPMHGPLLVWSALQSFTINHVSQLYSFYRKARQGSKLDQRALMIGLSHLLLAAGSMGFIGASTIEQLFEQFTGISLTTAIRKGLVTSAVAFADTDEEKERNALIADRAADTILYGLPGLVGVDASGSIGLGAPLVRYQAGQPLTLEQVGGAAVGMLARGYEAGRQIAADPFNPQSWWSATRSASPAFLSQVIRSSELMNSGTILDQNQQPVSDPLGVEGSVSALLGFTPMQVAKERKFKGQVYRQEKRASETYERVARNIAQNLYEFERTGDPELVARANKQFNDYLESVTGLQDRDAFVNSIARQKAEFAGKVTQPASLKTSQQRQQLETSFPTVASRYEPRLQSSLSELEVAGLLGQDDVLLRKLKSLSSGALDKVLADALVEVGVRPEEVQFFLSPRNAGRLGGQR